MNIVRAGFGNDVDDAAGGATEFSAGSVSDDLKLLDCFQRDVDGGALASELFPKKTVVVVAAVETDVIKDAALAGEIYFVAIWSLNDADARGQREEILKLASQNWRRADSGFVEGGAYFGSGGIDSRRRSDRHTLFDR